MGNTNTAADKYKTVAPECFVIKHIASGQYLTDRYTDWDDDSYRPSVIRFDWRADAHQFRSVAEAREFISRHRIDPRKVQVVRWQPVVELTDAGKAAVADRIAARRANRKF